MRALERAYSPGHHGRWSARKRAALVDDAVTELAEGLGQRMSVVALGGYGRRLLLPGSDVDLMVLHRERRPQRAKEAAERLFYPFWDAGIPLGHAVRTIDECVRHAGERVDVACSLLDGRHVGGDSEAVEELRARLLGRLRAEPAAFIRGLRADAAARHERFPPPSMSLEPDVKEGSGGLRDLHLVGWAAAVLPGGGDPVVSGLLLGSEWTTLDEAEEFLVRIRSALHIVAGRRIDRLSRELQPELATALGFDAVSGLDAPDALMRALFGHARQVEHVRDAFLDRAMELMGGVEPAEAVPPTSSEEVMAALASVGAGGSPPSARWLDAAAASDLDSVPSRWTDATRTAFVEVLASDRGDLGLLERIDRAGLLSRFLPEWEAVRCRPQRDPYHRFTVDVHLARTVAGVARLLSFPDEDPLLRWAAEQAEPRASALLGALLHDIGKIGEGRHVEVGIRVAGTALERMGAPAAVRDDVIFLVREHLLLPETATRRDLSERTPVLEVASRVGESRRLAMLALLAFADAEATGSHAASPWRLALVRELVSKVRRVLDSGELEADDTVLTETKLSELRERLLPSSSPLGSTEVRTAGGPGERAGTYDLTVVARDRPGLLARIAGSLALSGLGILSAEAHTTEDGIAVDLFVVEPAFHGDVDEERWRRVRHTLRKALEGRLSLEYRVREKRAQYPPSDAGVQTEVRVLNDASDFATVVEVEAADRLGLLFDLARAFEELHLDVSLAKVATYGSRVVDAFYVRDLNGEKARDPEQMGEIERAVRARLDGT